MSIPISDYHFTPEDLQEVEQRKAKWEKEQAEQKAQAERSAREEAQREAQRYKEERRRRAMDARFECEKMGKDWKPFAERFDKAEAERKRNELMRQQVVQLDSRPLEIRECLRCGGRGYLFLMKDSNVVTSCSCVENYREEQKRLKQAAVKPVRRKSKGSHYDGKTGKWIEEWDDGTVTYKL